MKRKLWRALTVLLVLLLVVSLVAGCGQKADTGASKGEDEKKKEEPADEYANYPEKPIQLIVPYRAGGGTDTLTRTFIKYLDLGQPIVVVNMAGASGSVGTMEAYNAKPDGYTLLCMGPHSMLAYNLSGTLPAPAWRDMECIGTVVSDANVISVSKDSKFKTIEDLLKFAKENPGKLKWGSVGSGGTNHVASATIWKAAGIEVNYVPYDSASKSRVALMGNHVDCLLSQVSEIQNLAASGEVIPLAVCTKDRSKHLPDVPALSEVGVDIDSSLLRAFWAPPKTPKPIVKKLEKAFEAVTKNPEYLKQIEDEFKYTSIFIGNEETHDMLMKDAPLWEELVKLCTGN